MQILRDHFQEFIAMTDVDFREELALEKSKKKTGNMNARFKYLIAKPLDFAQLPFKADTKHCGAIALEMAELQADNKARINFDVFQDIAKFWAQLPNKHSKNKHRASQDLERFGTTYVCEAGLSLMVFIKNDYRSRIINIDLKNSLVCCLTSYIPRYRKLIKQ